MFTTLIVQPIFNLLVLIFAVLPGHNFGLAIILFTIVVRLLMWPLVKKQLHSAKAMRSLQPEIKRIKKEAAGDRQKESMMTMELYKERGINPFSSLGLVILQLPILLGLYAGLRRIVQDPHAIVSFAYPALQHLGWMKELAADIGKFDQTLFGVVDLTRAAVGSNGGGIYWPAMVLVIGSAITQYYQSKQLMPVDKDARKLRDILKDAGKGSQADSSEVNAAVTRGTRYIIPIMILLVTLNIASALSLYWFVGGLIAILQQSRVLKQDEEEMEDVVAPKSTPKAPKKDLKSIVEAEIVETKPKKGKSTVTKVTRSSTSSPAPKQKAKKRRR
jgi:YidC/Oxa1 family membrane protein insertase